MDIENLSLFECDKSKGARPLAYRARPTSFTHFIGHQKIFKRFPFLHEKNFPSLILWGPPGCGKTTLASLLGGQGGLEIFHFSAVLGGIPELKKIIHKIQEKRQFQQLKSIIFIDEIHRFNKAQQDALLPHVENGDFTLIGATTENPHSALNRPLLSRVQCIELQALSERDILDILKQNAEKFKIPLEEGGLEVIADYSNGDSRVALNILELAHKQSSLKTAQIKQIILANARDYDKSGNRHYDVISAFIKSMRGSDPDATLYWLAVMLDGGEDPAFIARRLVIFASEDVGNADINGLPLAVSCLTAVKSIGMPEARINLAQAATYLAATVKSNAAYLGINSALKYIRENKTQKVPDHLKSFPPKDAENYLYPHDFPQHFVTQQYTEQAIPCFYHPTDYGHEVKIKKRLNLLRQSK